MRTVKPNDSQYARSLIEASQDPLVTINKNGIIMDVNEAMVRISGKKRIKLTGSDFSTYFTKPEDARTMYREVFEKGFIRDASLVIKNRKRTSLLFNGSLYKSERGKVLGVLVVGRDITQQRVSEKELVEAIIVAEMATEIAEASKREAEKATEIAEEAVKAKQHFLSNMSHEIRTPMNAIIGFTKVLQKTDMTPKQKEYLLAIKMSGDSLIVLINDILDLAKVDAGKMEFEHTPFNLSASISAMIHLFEPRILEKNLKLIQNIDNNIPETLLGDPVRLHQIFNNLLSNALKFTNKGTISITVKQTSEDEHSAAISFSVKDTGIGIPENKIDKIFENFQQASSHTSRLYGGTGLGLAIVKNLVESQGGNITVKSTLNKGSTFCFTMRFIKSSGKTEPELYPEIQIENNKEIRVLIVEDIPLNQLLMKTMLDEFGFTNDIAGNGNVALRKMKTTKYDIILMDLQMPEKNGFETTMHIRNKMKSHIPIIALTADVTTVDLAKCRKVGMNDYLAKPVDEKLLYSKIISLTCKPAEGNMQAGKGNLPGKKIRCTDLAYLIRRTKSDPELMIKMISLYLEQTPPLIKIMKESSDKKDFQMLYSAIHKMIPSFALMGISKEYEEIAFLIQTKANSGLHTHDIPKLVNELEIVCLQACSELETELKSIVKMNIRKYPD